MKKGQQYIYPIKMNIKEMFALFNSALLPTIEFIDSKNVIFFKVDSLPIMLEIEKKLLESNPKLKGKKIVSNNKTLFFKASLIPKNTTSDMWRLCICQENSNGIIWEKKVSLDSYADIGEKLFAILIVLSEKYHRVKFEKAQMLKLNKF